MSQKIIILVVIVLILFIGGIWFATLLPGQQPFDATQGKPLDVTQGKLPLFTDLRLGTPVRASFASQKNPPIKQKTDYTVNEPIMLQTTTTAAVKDSVQVFVRLVDTTSKIIALKPETVTLAPGTSAFCCWTIPTPGTYNIQVLRPDSITTNLPITITRDLSAT